MPEAAPLETLLPPDHLVYHQRLIGTRWLAGAGIIGLTLLSVSGLGLALPAGGLLLLGSIVLGYNALLVVWVRARPMSRFERLILVQVILDWLSLVVFVHLTGGITSPGLVLFFIHIIIVTILLPGASPYGVLIVMLLAVMGMALLEAQRILPHYTVIPGLPLELYTTSSFIAAQLLFFAVTLGAAAYITSSIMQPLRQREYQLRALYETTQAVSASLDLTAVLDQLAQNARQGFAAAGAAVYLLEHRGKLLKLAAAAGRGAAGRPTLPLSPAVQRLLSGELLRLDMAHGLSEFTADIFEVRAALLVPIVSQHALGVLAIYGDRPFAPDQQPFARAIARQGAIALEHARAHQALLNAEKQRTQFVHIVTHELRAPVTGAQSLVRVMLQGLAGTLTPQQADLLNRLSKRMDALLGLINDLLSLAASKARDTQQPLQPVDVRAALRLAIDQASIAAQEKALRLLVDAPEIPLWVLATDEGLLRIFDNLIGNAIKYTPPGGTVSVALHPAEREAQISVRDTGIGISAEALNQIGSEFYRAPNARSTGILGTGLGLATVKHLLEHFAGRLQIESSEGQGSTFIVSLPLEQPVPVALPAP